MHSCDWDEARSDFNTVLSLCADDGVLCALVHRHLKYVAAQNKQATKRQARELKGLFDTKNGSLYGDKVDAPPAAWRTAATSVAGVFVDIGGAVANAFSAVATVCRGWCGRRGTTAAVTAGGDGNAPASTASDSSIDALGKKNV
jgi:hypothetical protein